MLTNMPARLRRCGAAITAVAVLTALVALVAPASSASAASGDGLGLKWSAEHKGHIRLGANGGTHAGGKEFNRGVIGQERGSHRVSHAILTLADCMVEPSATHTCVVQNRFNFWNVRAEMNYRYADTGLPRAKIKHEMLGHYPFGDVLHRTLARLIYRLHKGGKQQIIEVWGALMRG